MSMTESKKNEKRKQYLYAGVLMIFGALLITGGIIWSCQNQTVTSTEIKADTTPALSEKSNVTIKTTIEGFDGGIDTVAYELKDKQEQVVQLDQKLAAKVTETIEIPALAQGTYVLHTIAVPICLDGSTYQTPEPIQIEVSGDGKEIELSVKLELLPKEKMTKEQLLDTAAALHAAGFAEESAQTYEAAEKSTVDPSHAVPTPGHQGSHSPNQPDADKPQNTVPQPSVDPNAGKTWHEAITEQRWIVDIPARQEPVYGEYVVTSDGKRFQNTDDAIEYIKSQGRGANISYSVAREIVSYTTIPEQGHWETVVVREAGWY